MATKKNDQHTPDTEERGNLRVKLRMCSKCLFWFREEPNMPVGRCKANPPVFTIDSDHRSAWEFPRSISTDFCHHWTEVGK